MSTPDDRSKLTDGPRPLRKPYVQPKIETEQVLEKQLLVICYTVDEGCEQDPPQS